MATHTLDAHIDITPGICGGKPRIAGHRITIQDIAVWHERLGRSADEISEEHELSLADVYAALAYYFDHRAEIDASLQADQAFVESVRRRTSSKVEEKLQRPDANSN